MRLAVSVIKLRRSDSRTRRPCFGIFNFWIPVTGQLSTRHALGQNAERHTAYFRGCAQRDELILMGPDFGPQNHKTDRAGPEGVLMGVKSPVQPVLDNLAIFQNLGSKRFMPGISLMPVLGDSNGFSNFGNAHQALANLGSIQHIHRRFTDLDCGTVTAASCVLTAVHQLTSSVLISCSALALIRAIGSPL